MVAPLPTSDPRTRLTATAKAAIAALMILFVAFGAITELRGAFLHARRTDAGVYFRAGWAVQADTSLYWVADDNNWHYHYPPLLAILMVPFADPPPGAPPVDFALPYKVAIAVWYVVNLAALALAIHLLAGALEARFETPGLRRPPRYGPQWWLLRLGPLAVCLPMVLFTLVRGQVNILILLGLCGMAAGLLRGRRLSAGLWLAGAICIKPFVAFLLLDPIWRRDLRCLAGCAMGLVVGLVLIPLVALGPERTLTTYQELYTLRLAAMVTGHVHPSVAGELRVTDANFPNLANTLYKALHIDPASRAEELPPVYTLVALSVGSVLTLITLGAAGWVGRRPWRGPGAAIAPPGAAAAELLFLGALAVVMLPMVPTLKPHYYALALPLLMGLVAIEWERRGKPELGRAWIAAFVAYIALGAITELPELLILRELGAITWINLGLWLTGVAVLWRWRRGGGRLADGAAHSSAPAIGR